jgi:threonine synthase
MRSKVRGAMASLKQSGFRHRADDRFIARTEFRAGRATEKEVAATIAKTLEKTGYLLDPHTAIGVFVANKHEKRTCRW